MSDTPLTEHNAPRLLHSHTPYPVHEPQVTNYDEVANLKGIIEELMKDKERLDWLIDHAYIQFYKVDDGGEWEMELDASDARNHIDKEMEAQ